MQRVTSREFQRNFGRFQDEALKAPLSITPNGRERLVILSAEEYTRLKRRDRQAIAVENLSDAEGGREALVAPITHRPPPDTVGAVAIPRAPPRAGSKDSSTNPQDGPSHAHRPAARSAETAAACRAIRFQG